MITHPTAAEFLRAIAAWLDAGGADRGGYMALVARNAIGIVQRELELSAEVDARATGRLEKLLHQTGDLATLEAELSARIRNGLIAPAAPGLLEHLRLQLLDRLAIDQPRYRHELRARP